MQRILELTSAPSVLVIGPTVWERIGITRRLLEIDGSIVLDAGTGDRVAFTLEPA